MRWLAVRYASADPRSLALLRIALGLLLAVDVLRRFPDLAAHYSNAGWRPNYAVFAHPLTPHLFSLHLSLSTPTAVAVLLSLQVAVSLLLCVGYRTRWMQIASALLVTSLDSRTILLENGGFVVLNLLAVWTLFLPLGRRLSVDAWLASWRGEVEGSVDDLNRRLPRDTTPVVSLAVSALIAQWAVIYFFNTLHKDGSTWQDGTAVYYFFQQDRMLTSFGGLVRHHIPFAVMRFASYATLAIEAGLTALLLSPVLTQRARMLAWGLALVLHGSIAAVVNLGPFSWAMVLVFFAFVPASVWSKRAQGRPEQVVELDPERADHLGVARVIRRLDLFQRVRFAAGSELRLESGERGVAAVVALGHSLPFSRIIRLFARPIHWLASHQGVRERLARGVTPGESQVADPPSDAARAVVRWRRIAAEALVALLLYASALQVLIENRGVPASLKPQRPRWLEALVIYPRMFQGWSMFAPNPPAEDGKIVVDAVTVEGRHVDPLTGRTPDFDVNPPGGFHFDQLWGDLHRRLADPKFAALLPGFRDYLMRYPERTGRAEDRIDRLEIWYVSEHVPPPGEPPSPPTRRRLLAPGASFPLLQAR